MECGRTIKDGLDYENRLCLCLPKQSLGRRGIDGMW